MTRRLLVISHEASRTGAPRVLLELLRHLKAVTDVELAVQLSVGGPLADDLLALDDAIDPRAVGAVLVNSSLAASAVRALPSDLPAALYVHEDGTAVAQLPQADRDAIERYDHVLCVSDEIKEELVASGVERERVSVLPPLVVAPPVPSDDEVSAARAAMGAAPGQRIVLGCGEAGWRKGADLYLAMASALSGDESLCFAWLGRRSRPFGRLLDEDARTLGMGDRVRWLGEAAVVGPHLRAADVLVMTSRYDPQPLVALEAASLGTPTVGFAVGGITELAEDGGALVVPFPDVHGLATLVKRVVDDPCAPGALVDGAVRRWRGRQSIEVVGPRFVDVVEQLLGTPRP
jgi:glycosyltransferase involved in cell wall biosynthesis